MINGIIVHVFENGGILPNDAPLSFIENHIDNGNLILAFLGTVFTYYGTAYHVQNWEINSRVCKTNLAMNTACRSPGLLPLIAYGALL